MEYGMKLHGIQINGTTVYVGDYLKLGGSGTTRILLIKELSERLNGKLRVECVDLYGNESILLISKETLLEQFNGVVDVNTQELKDRLTDLMKYLSMKEEEQR